MSYSVEDLEAQAQLALDKFQPQLAIEFFKRIFELKPSHETATQIGILTEDPKWFEQSIALDSKKSKSYFPYAQILQSEQALEMYLKGIENATSTIEDLKCCSDAYCAIVELYMTDLCDLPEAESNCEKYIQRAIDLNNDNAEAFSTFASVRLSQQNNEDALVKLMQGMKLWYTPKDEEDAIVNIDQNWPAYQTRMLYAKLFIETGEFENAILCLETVEVENDEDAELWYLYGWCYLSLAKAKESADYLVDAKDCFETVLQLGEKFKDEENQVSNDILEHSISLLDEINCGDIDMQMQ